RYFKGTQEPPWARNTSWQQISYNDAAWPRGYAPLGYGESFIATNLSDMRGQYSTVYLRKSFDVASIQAIGNLVLEVMYDDGVSIWINGVHVMAGNTPSVELPFDYTVNNRPENHGFTSRTLVDPSSYLVDGTNVIAVQVINSSLRNSSDCFIDVRLIADPATQGESLVAVPNYSRRPGKYEIDAVWESAEITDSSNTVVQIPASKVRPGRTYRVRCRMKDNTQRWSHWSDPVQFVAGEPVAAGILDNLRITELMYNPADPPVGAFEDTEEFEFIELKNVGDETLDLTGVSFVNGIAFDFAGNRIESLGAGEFVLVVKNEVAFRSRYGTALSGRIAGEYAGRLANDGERLALWDFWNGTIAEFTYADSRGWPLGADGAGHSLVPLASAVQGQGDGSLDYGGNWRASTYLGGSPGTDDPEPVSVIVLNEVMANTDYGDPQDPGPGSNDWIELYNVTSESVSLRDWYLSDDVSDLKKWAIGDIEMAAYSYASFDEITGVHTATGNGFGLNKAGEMVILSYLPGTSEDRIADSVRFKAQGEMASLGRYPDGGKHWFEMTPSRGLPNTSPAAKLVIDELMYHPAKNSDDEYIELYNPTADRIYLENSAGPWRLDGGVGYTFPPETSIAAGDRLIVVGFDPTADPDRLDAFLAAYSIGSLVGGANIVGPWSGNLSNSGERIALEKPQPPARPDDPVAWMIVDEVMYSDVLPWPKSADGTGDVLQRISADPHRSGNDPHNWRAASPTPGQ
ncbi:MAG: lamin tail domain-containing protein, partial [Planctomycetota bacterium]